MYCSDCGYKFENYDDNECRLCGSTRKSYRVPKPKGYSRKSYRTAKPKGYSRKAGRVGKKVGKKALSLTKRIAISFSLTIVASVVFFLVLTGFSQISNVVNDDGIYQISISEIPSFADKGTINSSISKAMMMWENSNPELEFELTDERGEIRIVWEKYMGEHAGQITGGLMEIELGSYDCRGNWQQYSSNMIADTIAHEIGHYLGLEHHTNDSHLMYGDDEFTQIVFDDLGYNIPNPNSKYMTWIEWEKLEQQLERYDSSNNVNAYNRIVEEMNCIADM